MSSGLALVGAPQLAVVCELHVCNEALRSWFVFKLMVRIVVPDALMRVLSVGLSVVIFRYCAAAEPAKHIEIRSPRTKCRTANFMHPSLSKMERPELKLWRIFTIAR